METTPLATFILLFQRFLRDNNYSDRTDQQYLSSQQEAKFIDPQNDHYHGKTLDQLFHVMPDIPVLSPQREAKVIKHKQQADANMVRILDNMSNKNRGPRQRAR